MSPIVPSEPEVNNTCPVDRLKLTSVPRIPSPPSRGDFVIEDFNWLTNSWTLTSAERVTLVILVFPRMVNSCGVDRTLFPSLLKKDSISQFWYQGRLVHLHLYPQEYY